jgi:phosphatidylglycerol:prolipoprotein diacylglycerol transferase
VLRFPQEEPVTSSAPLPETWGVRPVLCRLGPFEVPAYGTFMVLAVAVGILVYYREAAKHRALSENTFYIFVAALVGGALGAKVPLLFLYWREIFLQHAGWSLLVSGRSIVGGLIGGAVSVIVVKRVLHINERKGNLFAPAIALGVAVGRIGCFLRGCCYGTPTSLPWGVNFGDGIPRHPTQLYEALFMLGMFGFLTAIKHKVTQPGALFRILMVGYFSFRFANEFIRVEGGGFWGLTFFQWISLVALAWYSKDSLRAVRKASDVHEYVR